MALTKEGRSLIQGLIEGAGLGVVLEVPNFITQEAACLMSLPDMLAADFFRADGGLILHLGRLDGFAAPSAKAFAAARRSGLEVGRLQRSDLAHPPMVFLAPIKSKDG